ncbi:MAG: GAF domain-containing protein [Clostridia bacterium]|nr:GAF domain-containing protein [Clostridia bacterium]
MTDYEILDQQAREIISADPWYVPALSNLSALLMDSLPDLNWAGFYLLRNRTLVVGPFQGKPACVHIPVGKGVCGTAIAEDRTVVVPDVHQFPGHIACDSASRSEIVIPLHRDGKPVGVMDIDSPKLNRFSEADAAGLKRIVEAIERMVVWA